MKKSRLEIATLVEYLNKTGHGKCYNRQAMGLATFMLTGIGNEAQNLNAKNIAEGRLRKTPMANKGRYR